MFEGRNEQRVHARIAGRGVGASLRAAREAGGETIFDAARALRIRAEYLYALEEDDFQSLPGWAYALSYVRTYAEYLGLEASPVVKEVREQYELRQHMLFAEAAKASDNPTRRRVAGLIAVLLVAVGLGWYLTGPAASLTGIFDPIPRHIKALVDRSFFTVTEDVDPVSSSPPTTAFAIDQPAADEIPSLPTSTAAVAISSSTETRFGALRDQPEADEMLVIGSESGDARRRGTPIAGSLVLRARAPVWLTVEDGSGSVLLARQLRKGELYHLPSDPGTAVSADDAGAVEYYIDGRLVGILGPDHREISRVPVGRLTQGHAGG